MGNNMSRYIPERDWKKLRALKDIALNNACERAFSKVNKVIDGRCTESHKSYLKLWKVLKAEDKEISLMFDDLKRSNAILKLSVWKRNKILPDKEFEEFTEETQKRIKSLCDIRR